MKKIVFILLIGLFVKSRAQVIYTDVSPDYTITTSGFVSSTTKPLDINNDGINDFDLVATNNYAIRSTYLVPKNGNKFICKTNLVDTLNVHDSIAQSSLWCTSNAYLLNYDFSQQTGTGYWRDTANQFIGVAITGPGGFYYGWIRMRHYRTIADYAYNATINQPIAAGDNLPYIAENTTLLDIADNGNGSDVKIKFNKAMDETKVSAYRVLMVPIQHISSYTIDSAKRVPLSNSFPITPLNKNVDTVLNVGTTDVYGNSMGSLRTYKALVVSYPNLITAFDTLISAPSNSLTLKTPNKAASQPTVTSTIVSGNNYSVTVNFNAAVTENGILEYRLYFIEAGDSIRFSLDTANHVPATNYISIAPTGTNQVLNFMSPNLVTVKGQLLGAFKKYKCLLMSYTDSLVSNFSSLSQASNSFTVYTQVQPVNTIWVEDIADNHLVSDIKVSFKKAANENNIVEYRGIIVSKAESLTFNLDSANHTSHYISFIPNGSDQSIILPSGTSDYKGNPVTESNTWYFYVLSIYNPLNSDVNALCNKPKYFAYSTPDHLSAGCFQCSNVMVHDINDVHVSPNTTYSLDIDSNGVIDVLFTGYASGGIGAYFDNVTATMQNNTQMSCDVTNPNGPFIIAHDSLDMNYYDLGWKTGTGCFRSLAVQNVPYPPIMSTGGLWTSPNQKYMHVRLIGADTVYAWIKILVPTYSSMNIYSYGLLKTCSNTSSVTATSSSSLSCASEAVTLSAGGANSYTWSTGSTSPNIVVTPSATTTYTVEGINSIGCMLNSIVTQSVADIPSLTITSSTNVSCASEPITLTVNGANSYTWSTASSGPTLTVVPNTTTTYTVEGANTYGCLATAMITQSVVTCAGIKENEARNVEVYPNPVTNILTVNDSHHDLENAELEIWNYSGQLVLQQSYSYTIDVSKLSAGLYTLQIIGKNKQRYYSKFIKE